MIEIIFLRSRDVFICVHAGLKVNDQLVAHATRFLIVRLKIHVITLARLKSPSSVRLNRYS